MNYMTKNEITTVREEACRILSEEHARLKLGIPLSLVMDCFEIQDEYQYEADSDVRFQALQELVTLAVDDMMNDSADESEGEDQ